MCREGILRNKSMELNIITENTRRILPKKSIFGHISKKFSGCYIFILTIREGNYKINISSTKNVYGTENIAF